LRPSPRPAPRHARSGGNEDNRPRIGEIINKLIEVIQSGKIDKAIEALNIAEEASSSGGRVFSKTSSSSYRRLHDVLSHTIDRAQKLLRREDTNACAEARKELVKCAVLAKYQVSRGVLDEDIYRFVKSIYETLRNENNCKLDTLENIRLAIDTLATIVKAYAKR